MTFTIPGTGLTYTFNNQPTALTAQEKKSLRLEICKKLPPPIVPFHATLVSNGKTNLLISGISGSGKTTLAKALSSLDFKIIANDFVVTWSENGKVLAVDINLQELNVQKKPLPIHHVCFLQPDEPRDLFRTSFSSVKSIYSGTLFPLDEKIISGFLSNILLKSIFNIHCCLGNRQSPERWVRCIQTVLSNNVPTRIGVIGMGTIGQDLANLLVGKPWLSSLSLYSPNQDKLKSVVLDLKSANPKLPISQAIDTGTIFKESDLVVLCFNQNNSSKTIDTTNERHRKILIHSEVCQEIANEIKGTKTFRGFILVVTNPVDFLSWYLYEKSELLSNQIYGIGLGIDMKRLQTLTKKKLEVFGEHGDEVKIAKIENNTIVPVDTPILLSQLKTYSNKIREFTPRTRFGPVHEIVSVIESFRKRGSIIRASTIYDGIFTGQTIILNNGIPTRKYNVNSQVQEALDTTKKIFEDHKKMGKDHTISPHK